MASLSRPAPAQTPPPELAERCGTWRLAGPAPTAVMTEIGLPRVTARFMGERGEELESPLFVVASPAALTREQKAVLIDARTEVPPERFAEYLKRMVRIWENR